MIEEWRSVREDGLYEVSNLGRVRSWRAKGRVVRRRSEPLIMKTPLDSGGYPCTVVTAGRQRRTTRVHVLVAAAFLGPCPEGKELIAHWDGDRTNNRVENLRWATKKENSQDALRHGTYPTGDLHWNWKHGIYANN